MIQIDIKLLPFGEVKNKKLLYRINIANDGSGNTEIGNYTATLRQGVSGTLLGYCNIKDFPRQELTAFNLLYEALKKMIGRVNVRNKKAIQTAAKERLLQEAQQADTNRSV